MSVVSLMQEAEKAAGAKLDRTYWSTVIDPEIVDSRCRALTDKRKKKRLGRFHDRFVTSSLLRVFRTEITIVCLYLC